MVPAAPPEQVPAGSPGDFADAWPAAMRLSPLCVGIDPHAATLEQWGLGDTAKGAREFSMRMLQATVGAAGAIKPQSAFFERFGSAGIAVLEEVLAAARQAGLVSVLDVKRGDIGSTMTGYADAYLNPTSPLAADAITVSPYLGVGSLQPAFDASEKWGRGVFVLALTSNPDGPQVQHAQAVSGAAVAAEVCKAAAALNEEAGAARIGLVVGATIGDAASRLGIDLGAFNGPLLAPGLGVQGAGVDEYRAVFGDAFTQARVLVCASREVSHAGPSVEAVRERILALTGVLRHENG